MPQHSYEYVERGHLSSAGGQNLWGLVLAAGPGKITLGLYQTCAWVLREGSKGGEGKQQGGLGLPRPLWGLGINWDTWLFDGISVSEGLHAGGSGRSKPTASEMRGFGVT